MSTSTTVNSWIGETHKVIFSKNLVARWRHITLETPAMGHIIMPTFAFRESLSEDAGVRAGLALSQQDLLKHLDPESDIAIQLRTETVLRLGSDRYADTVGDLLFAFGVAESKGMPTLAQRFMRKLECDWRDLFTLDQMLQMEAIAHEYLRRRNGGAGGYVEIYTELKAMFNRKMEAAWEALQDAMATELAQSPFYTRSLDKVDVISLSALFQSEQLPEAQGCFFDQRFINYLAAQPDRLLDIHWRQFEGMTAEWFQRQGYTVELGAGRGDGGVDVRLWKAESPPGEPAAVIVQCKRQKHKIEKVVVKGLYADLLHEQAGSALVVTTSHLSPGAADDISARAYPITAVNRLEVGRWIEEMRKPYAGIVLDFDR